MLRRKPQQCDKLYELILRLADATEKLARSARADESLISRIGSILHEALLMTSRPATDRFSSDR